MNVLFLCSYGGAKSVMAASYFNQLGLPIEATAASAEEPYEAVPAPVAELLAGEGVDVRSFRPRQVTEEDLRTATRVISIGCEVASDRAVERWDDVPQASEDLHGSAEAIRRHVEALAAELRER